MTGASLSSDELCSAERFVRASRRTQGLRPHRVRHGGRHDTYDEDATVANLAAELRVFGIEPCHLRLYKNAVDREVGLIEQVIIPLLRQRNPPSPPAGPRERRPAGDPGPDHASDPPALRLAPASRADRSAHPGATFQAWSECCSVP